MDEYPKVLYRYESEYRPTGLFGSDEASVYLKEYPVVKHTPCGVWIATDTYQPYAIRQGETPRAAGCKWVDLEGRKRYAYPDKDDALESLRMRKIWQARYARGTLALAEATIEEIKRMRGEKDAQCEGKDDASGNDTGSISERMSILQLPEDLE